MKTYLSSLLLLFALIKDSDEEALQYSIEFCLNSMKSKIISFIENIGKDINVKLEVQKTFQQKKTMREFALNLETEN